MLLSKLVAGLEAGDVLAAKSRQYRVTQHIPGALFRVARVGGSVEQVIDYRRHPGWAQEWAKEVEQVKHQPRLFAV